MRSEQADEMVRCSNADCCLGTWFHVTCLSINDVPVGDWWCSEECRDSGQSIFCCCKRVRDGPVVTCANDDCQNGTTFHVDCLNIFQQFKPGMFEICQCSSDCCIFCFFYFDEKKHISYLTVAFVCQWLRGYISELVTCTGEDWFCSPDCATSDSQPRDAVLDYSRSVTCHGLLDMCHRDAVREADGQAMMTIWRVNMPRFWGGRHFKYLRVGHRLLAGIEFYNGCLYDATNC